MPNNCGRRLIRGRKRPGGTADAEVDRKVVMQFRVTNGAAGGGWWGCGATAEGVADREGPLHRPCTRVLSFNWRVRGGRKPPLIKAS